MLFNGSALIFTYSRTQVRIAEHERLQSLAMATSMAKAIDVDNYRVIGRRRVGRYIA